MILTPSPSPSPSPNPSPNPNPNPNPAQVRSSSAVLRMQLTEIDTDGNGVIDEGEWLVYIKAQSVANSAATKKLLRAFAKQCGAELDFDAMKRAEVTLPSSTISLLVRVPSYHLTLSPVPAPNQVEQAEQRELAEAERRLREEKRKVDSEARQSLQDRTSSADPGAA